MSLPRSSLAVVLWLIAASSALAASELVKQIRTSSQTEGSLPYWVQPYGSGAVFTAVDFEAGSRIWKTDGTSAGTIPLVDAAPSAYTGTGWMKVIGSTIWFSGNDGIHGNELWKSDGTQAGTVMVKDIVPGSAWSSIMYVTDGGAYVYFVVADDLGGELWRTDGTASGTLRLTQRSGPIPIGVVSGGFLFTAWDSAHGRELWVTDGTEAGTHLVKDVRAGEAGNDTVNNFAIIDGSAYMVLNDGVHGAELWKSDGTEAGTVLVKDIQPGAGSGASQGSGTIATIGAEVIFAASDGLSWPARLWKSNGTAQGTVEVAVVTPTDLTSWGARVAFTTWPASEIWMTDGTAGGTQKLGDFERSQVAFSSKLHAAGSKVFLFEGNRLYVSDGTPEGTKLVRTFATTIFSTPPDLAGLVATIGNTVVFPATDALAGHEIWRSDGTAEGTTVVRDINSRLTGAQGSRQFHSSVLGDSVIFTALDDVGQGLWKSNGTTAGTTLIGYNQSSRLSRVGDRVWLTAYGSGIGSEPAWTDGSTVTVIPEIASGSNSSVDSGTTYHDLGGVAYFAAYDASTGSELWRSNGSTATRVADINPGSPSSSPGSIVVMGSSLFFAATDATNGRELWTSDGTTATLLKNIHPSGSSDPANLTVIGSYVYFFADDGANGRELWRTNGTANGTELVKNAIPGAAGLAVSQAIAVGNTLFFITANQLWKSDGTADGTLLVREFGKGFTQATYNLPALYAVAGKLVFFADDGTTGREPWVSNGTPEGTFLLRNIHSGPAPSATWSAMVFGSMLYFTAQEPGFGAELWRTDGTSAGTVLAADVATAFSSSAPLILAPLASDLLFFASTHTMGYQLYRYVCGPPTSLAAGAGPSPLVAGNSLNFTVMPMSNEAFCYGGTVSVTSTDPAAELPGTHTFVAGESEYTFQVVLKSAGVRRVTASDGTRTVSVDVTVNAASPDATRSTLSASQPTAAATEAVVINVRLEDAYGNAVKSATVALQTTHGTIGPVSNQNDGTYTATLTANTGGNATVSAVANGVPLSSTTSVVFAPTGATIVTAAATATTSVAVSWTAAANATAYDLYRGNTPLGSFQTLSTVVHGLTPATTYLFRVQPRADAALGPMSAPDLATTAMFTDDPIVVRETTVKRQHFAELVIAVNSVRAAALLAPISLRDLSGATILAADVQALRDGLLAARTALGFATTWTDPSLQSLPIRAMHLEQLRSAVK